MPIDLAMLLGAWAAIIVTVSRGMRRRQGSSHVWPPPAYVAARRSTMPLATPSESLLSGDLFATSPSPRLRPAQERVAAMLLRRIGVLSVPSRLGSRLERQDAFSAVAGLLGELGITFEDALTSTDVRDHMVRSLNVVKTMAPSDDGPLDDAPVLVALRAGDYASAEILAERLGLARELFALLGPLRVRVGRLPGDQLELAATAVSEWPNTPTQALVETLAGVRQWTYVVEWFFGACSDIDDIARWLSQDRSNPLSARASRDAQRTLALLKSAVANPKTIAPALAAVDQLLKDVALVYDATIKVRAPSEEALDDLANLGLRYARDARPDLVRVAFRAQLAERHPDRGGDIDDYMSLVASYRRAQRRLTPPLTA